MIKINRTSILLLLFLVATLAAAGLVLHSVGLLGLFMDRRELLAFIEAHRGTAVLWFIGLQALQVVAAPIPGEVTGFVGGVFFGPVWGVIYSTAGLTLGSWLAFMLARLMGRPLVERLVRSEIIERYDYVMRHKGLFLAFLLFLIPGFPKDYLSYVLGLGHMRQRDFLAVCMVGRLFGTVLLTLGGAYFRDQRYVAFSTVIGVALVAILLVMIYRDNIERLLRRLQGPGESDTRAPGDKPDTRD